MTWKDLKHFIADLARPFAIYATASAAAVATVKIAWEVKNAEGGAMFITAVFTGLGALYLGKAWEVQRMQGHTAEVEKARAAATTVVAPVADVVTTAAVAVVNPPADVVSEADGKLPVSDRVNP